MSNKASLRFIQVPQKRRINFQGINLNPVKDEPVGHTPEKKGEPTLGEKILSGNTVLKALVEGFNIEAIAVKKILETGHKYTKEEAVEAILDIIGGYEDLLASSVITEKGGSFSYFNPYNGKEEDYKDLVFKPRFTIRAERKGFRKKAEVVFMDMVEKGAVEAINQTGYYLVVK